MTYLTAIFLGVIQGVAEFLPISSSGHLVIFQNLFHMGEGSDLFFDVLLHLGTLAAVFAVYWKDIADIIREFFAMIQLKKARSDMPQATVSRRMILLLIMASLPLVFAVLFKDRVELLSYNTIFVGCALIITGVVLFFADRIRHGDKDGKNATVLDALLVGLAQVIAIVPGLSRSGATISAGLGCGFERGYAVKFSFLLSIPAILGANILSVIDAIQSGIDWSLAPIYLVGVLVAAVFGYCSIRLLHFIAKHGSFGSFSYYCWGAGIVTIVLSLIA